MRKSARGLFTFVRSVRACEADFARQMRAASKSFSLLVRQQRAT